MVGSGRSVVRQVGSPNQVVLNQKKWRKEIPEIEAGHGPTPPERQRDTIETGFHGVTPGAMPPENHIPEADGSPRIEKKNISKDAKALQSGPPGSGEHPTEQLLSKGFKASLF